MYRIKIILITLLFLSVYVGTIAEAGSLSNLNEYLSYVEANRNFSGSVLISKDGKIILERCLGSVDRPDNIFPVASLTKQFTAAAVMHLYDQGLLSLQNRLSKYLPELTAADQITIEHLLTHTSGLRDNTLTFNPGESWAYSDSGYIVLGKVIEKISGMKYEEYLKEIFFNPLGLDNTGLYQYQDEKTLIPQIDAVNRDMIEKAGSAGGLYSTVEDLSIWINALYSGKILKKSTFEMMLKEHVSLAEGGYGFGWFISQGEEKKAYHTGTLPGFSSLITTYPDQDLNIIILSDKRINIYLMGNVIACILAGEYKIPQIKKIDKTILHKYTGVYEVAQGFNIEVTAAGEDLFTEIPGQGRLQLIPAGEDLFFYQQNDVQIKFIRNNNMIDGLKYLIIGDDSIIARKIN